MKEDTKDLFYIGKLANGISIYDSQNSNWQTAHKALTLDLLQEALQKVYTNDNLFAQSVDMGRVVGKSYCVPITELDQVFLVKRIGRVGVTPTILNKPPLDSNKVAVVLEKKEDYYILKTAYIGELCPMQPWDSDLKKMNDEIQIRDAIDFWNTHALVYDSSVVEYVISKDGTRFEKNDFEKQYIYNKNKYLFDIPQDALLLMMGIPSNSKMAKAKGIANYLSGQIISSDEIREEFFELKKSNKEFAYSEAAKNIIYDEMLKRTEENLKNGTFTIADATFLFSTGEKARKNFYELAQKYNRPLRVIMVKIPLQVAKQKNQEKEEKVKEQVVEKMWKYMNNTYDDITNELKSLPDTKFEIVGQKECINM